MNQPQGKFWLDVLTRHINEAIPDASAPVVVSSGVSPSGRYHFGGLREWMTAEAVAWNLMRPDGGGRPAVHLHFRDDFDGLRKVPAGVDTSFAQYIGMPYYLVPSPDGEPGKSYADYFFDEFYGTIQRLKADTHVEVIYSHKAYQEGRFTNYVHRSLERLGEVKRIIAEVSKRQLGEDWFPVQVLDDAGYLNRLTVTGFDLKRKMIAVRDPEGEASEVNYEQEPGRVKLDWRLDWPARWTEWGVGVEPFGRDHASKGGSYDTGAELVKLLGGRAPLPVPYEFINRAGETVKMSSSKGNVVTPGEALEIMSSEVLRYFIVRSLPSRTLIFDTGMGLFNLIEEFSNAERANQTPEGREQFPFLEAYLYAVAGGEAEHPYVFSSVPFSHVVQVWQAAQMDFERFLAILERTEYAAEVKHEREILRDEVAWVTNWLEKYAPDKVKFAVQRQLPEVDLSAEQRGFLARLADTLAAETDLNGQGVHDAIYAAAEAAGVKPSEAFVALYRIILGQDAGPKAGWFLATLERDWLLQRLRLTD